MVLEPKAMQRVQAAQCVAMTVVISLSIGSVIFLTNWYKVPLVQNAFASLSPSFQRQEITLGSGNWFDIFSNNRTSSGPDYADIESVSYLSNGTYLNATLWLANFEKAPNDHENVNYGMYIDADSNNMTGFHGIDYKVEISWNNESRKWTSVFEEWSSSGKIKSLHPEENATDFFGDGDGRSYVTLSANLDSILSPGNYKVLFYAEVIDKKVYPFHWIIDSTNWISIPSPKLALVVLPDPIVLIQGEKDSIAEVRVNSSTPDELDVNLSLPLENTSNSGLMAMKLDSEKLHVPPFGEASTHLHVSVSPDIDPTNYRRIVRANVAVANTPLFAEIAGGSNESGTEKRSSNNGEDSHVKSVPELVSKISDQTVSKSSVFSLQVRQWSLEEQLSSFVNQWITPLSAIYTSLSSIVAGILGWIYGRRRSRQRRNNDYHGNNNNQRNLPDKRMQ